MKFRKNFYCLFFIFLSLFLISCSKNENASEKKAPAKEKEVVKYYASLTGEEIESDDSNNNRAFAVMFDNHPDAIPQAGLNDTDILYEFKAEGEFTRYMGIFKSKYPTVNIGPVRSARTYFVTTAHEYNAIYAHWGGSPDGYEQIPKLGVNDLDGIALEGITFFRNKDVNKKRPHNGYTTFEKMIEQSEKYKYDLKSKNEFYEFDHTKDKEKLNTFESINCDKVTLNFFKHYSEVLEYVPDSDAYLIVRNGVNVIDENDSKEYMPKNIIIEFADSKVTGDLGRLTVYNTGSGDGYLLTNGKLIEINWTKDDENSKTVYTTKAGENIVLNPGKTFITTIDKKDNSVVIENLQDEENKTSDTNTTTNVKK